MLKGFFTVGVWTLASRLLGFVRDMLTAAMLGAGPVADAYFIALRLPNLFRNLFGEGAFNAAFVPSFSGLLVSDGPEAARRFAEEAFSIMAFWLLMLTLLGEIFMPEVMAFMAPGFRQQSGKFALAVTLGRITFPYLLMICLAALVSGMLNGLHRFAAASAGYIYFNIVQIFALLVLVRVTPTAGHALAIGAAVSGVLQLGALLWSAKRAGMALRIRVPRLTPRIRVLLRKIAPGLIGAGVSQLNIAVDSVIASLLPAGTVAVLNYADRINQLPLGVLGSAVGMTLLPTLSRQLRGGDAAGGIATLNRAMEYALTLTIPAAVALMILAQPIMVVLFGHGAFSHADAVRSAESLSAFAIGLPAFVMVKVLTPGFFARGDTKTPLKVAMGAVTLNLLLNLLLMHPLQHMGPPLASSLAAMANVGCLLLLLRQRGHLAMDSQLLRRLPRMAAAALLMGAGLWALKYGAFDVLQPQGNMRLVYLASTVGSGLLVYAAAGSALCLFDMPATILKLRRSVVVK